MIFMIFIHFAYFAYPIFTKADDKSLNACLSSEKISKRRYYVINVW